MDAKHFDGVAKAIGQGQSRRRLLAGLLGATVIGSLGREAVMAKGTRSHRKRHPVQAQKGNSPNAKQCQKGGWARLAPSDAPTTPFANEEACVSYGAQGGTIVALVIPPPPPTCGAVFGACPPGCACAVSQFAESPFVCYVFGETGFTGSFQDCRETRECPTGEACSGNACQTRCPA
jgi:hypothetical protein